MKEEFIEENDFSLYLSDDEDDDDDKDNERLRNLVTAGNDNTLIPDDGRTRTKTAASRLDCASPVKENDCVVDVLCKKEPGNETPSPRKNVKHTSKVCTFDGCRKVFSRPSHLEYHMRKHTGEVSCYSLIFGLSVQHCMYSMWYNIWQSSYYCTGNSVFLQVT